MVPMKVLDAPKRTLTVMGFGKHLLVYSNHFKTQELSFLVFLVAQTIAVYQMNGVATLTMTAAMEAMNGIAVHIFTLKRIETTTFY